MVIKAWNKGVTLINSHTNYFMSQDFAELSCRKMNVVLRRQGVDRNENMKRVRDSALRMLWHTHHTAAVWGSVSAKMA